MAQLAAFVCMVHMARLATGCLDCVAMATSMGFAALEPTFGIADVVYRIDGHDRHAYKVRGPDLVISFTVFRDIGCFCASYSKTQCRGFD
jgi:hypothetical protein